MNHLSIAGKWLKKVDVCRVERGESCWTGTHLIWGESWTVPDLCVLPLLLSPHWQSLSAALFTCKSDREGGGGSAERRHKRPCFTLWFPPPTACTSRDCRTSFNSVSVRVHPPCGRFSSRWVSLCVLCTFGAFLKNMTFYVAVCFLTAHTGRDQLALGSAHLNNEPPSRLLEKSLQYLKNVIYTNFNVTPSFMLLYIYYPGVVLFHSVWVPLLLPNSKWRLYNIRITS